MDIFAHTLWTNAVFYPKYQNRRKQRYIAAMFGVIPDLVGFTPAFFYMLFSENGFNRSLFNSSVWVFKFASEAYNYTHSLVIFGAVALLVMLIRKGKFYWPMFGWALHILIDIPTHKGFYETPFLFPISDYRFSHGISWGNSSFMMLNYSALIVVYLLIWLYAKKYKKT
jgi:hypothetical protein